MRRAEAAGICAAFAAAAALVAYAIQRVVERRYFPEPNPALLIWTDSSAFFWRAGVSLYAAGLGAFGGLVLARRSPRSAARGLPWLIAGATAAILAQAALSP